ncbi:MAG: hypothetical protein ABSG41_03575 [Bryobacteraceae bacterium]|jgi:uncharacterized lipoprotein YajG
MLLRIFLACAVALLLLACEPASAQTPPTPPAAVTSQQVQTMLDRLAAQDVRIQQLELRVQQLSGATPLIANATEPPAAAQSLAPAAPVATPEGLNTLVPQSDA